MYRNTFCTTLSSVDKINSIQKFITVMTSMLNWRWCINQACSCPRAGQDYLCNYPVDYPCKPWLSCNQCQWTEAGIVTYNVCTTQAPTPFRDQSEDKKNAFTISANASTPATQGRLSCDLLYLIHFNGFVNIFHCSWHQRAHYCT